MSVLSTEAGEDNVVALRPRESSGDLRPGFRSLQPELSLVRDWPERTAVLVGNALHPFVVAVLRDAGFTPIVTTVDRAAATISELSPVSFLILGPDVFASDSSVAAVQQWRSYSPAARVKLSYPPAAREADVLVRAIRAGVTDVVDPDDRAAFDAAIHRGMTQAGATRERVLAIGAHPDDVEIGCAGTLLDHRRRGDRITVLTLSRGAIGGDQLQRVSESATTAEALGAQLLFGDLPDTRIEDGVATIRLIESVVAAIDPTVVYVHSKHDNHQDHRAVSTATRSATRGVRRVFAYQSPSATNEFLPTQFVNVDDTVRRKVEVLQMFRSQDGRSYLEPELVVAGARYWARHLAANARYAEPFEVIRSVGELRHRVQRAAQDAAALSQVGGTQTLELGQLATPAPSLTAVTR
jgi:two-component system, NtrC family, response regulator HydG